MTRIDSYLRAALDFWTDKKGSKNSLPKSYKGYVASFGTSVIHCGLLPAVFMFSRTSENSQTDEDKTWVIEGIFDILKKEKPDIAEKNLLDFVIAHGQNEAEKLLTSRVCDAAVALKLALRTFKLD